METERRARETCSYLHCEPFILTLTAPSKAAAPALEAGGEARAQLSGGLRTGREEESPPPASHAASNATQGGRPAPKATLTGASQKRAAKADIHFAALTAGSCWCGWNRLQYPTPPPPRPIPSPRQTRETKLRHTHTHPAAAAAAYLSAAGACLPHSLPVNQAASSSLLRSPARIRSQGASAAPPSAFGWRCPLLQDLGVSSRRIRLQAGDPCSHLRRTKSCILTHVSFFRNQASEQKKERKVFLSWRGAGVGMNEMSRGRPSATATAAAAFPASYSRLLFVASSSSSSPPPCPVYIYVRAC